MLDYGHTYSFDTEQNSIYFDMNVAIMEPIRLGKSWCTDRRL